MQNIALQVDRIIQEIREKAGEKDVMVAFSGGLDSTLVLNLARQALGRAKVTAVHVDFGPYSYQKTRENVRTISRKEQINLRVLPGESLQADVLKGGPDCNLCTRKVKLGVAKQQAGNQIVLTGSNQSDSWGEYGLDFCGGIYAPLFHISKDDINRIAGFLGIEIRRIGENAHREGCKAKHLLKPLVNPVYHGVAVNIANEILLERLRQSGISSRLANVKIIGPLSRNIALVNVFPLPNSDWLGKVCDELKQQKEIDECRIVDQPLELTIKANKGQFNNLRSRDWIEKGRLQPEFACPVITRWLLTTNRKLKTFQVIGYNIGRT